jgi:NADPH:quinone reductase-like Zn-dependent oxidoreductase
MPFINTAAWLDAAGSPLRIGPAPDSSSDLDLQDIIIKVHAVAINPVDAIQQSRGLLINEFPFIGGCDVAGEIVRNFSIWKFVSYTDYSLQVGVGSAVTKLKVGQRVMAQCSASTRNGNNAGTFQHYTVADQLPVCPLPDSMSYEAASTLPLCMSTAASGLYPPSYLGLEFPSLNPKQSGKTLLIWGGSSSVGCCAIQLAVASGLRVVTTCSPHNSELCRRLGAAEVFDHKNETVVENLIAELGKGKCAGVYNGELHSPCLALAPGLSLVCCLL